MFRWTQLPGFVSVLTQAYVSGRRRRNLDGATVFDGFPTSGSTFWLVFYERN